MFKIMDITQPLEYVCLIYRVKQLFHELKRDKLEQQLQRDAELKRTQAATSVQAWWRGYRWVAFIVQCCLYIKIVLPIPNLKKSCHHQLRKV
jgi:anti-sigma factor RsiW